MIEVDLTRPYQMLGRLLAPALDPGLSERLRRLHAAGRCDWTRVLGMANRHLVSPLWFVRMRQHQLLDLLPPEMTEYLASLHLANCERNTLFRNALIELLPGLDAAGIPVVALKGGAALVDDLYRDPGARLMGDLDLLVPAERVDEAAEHLLQSGYLFNAEFARSVEGLSRQGFHHLPPLLKPQTPICIELHFRVTSRQGANALPNDWFWENTWLAALDGGPVRLPSAVPRLLHNCVHTLQSGRAWIRSRLSLAGIAEGMALWHRDAAAYDAALLCRLAERGGMRGEVSSYLDLLQLFRGHEGVPGAAGGEASGKQLQRLLEGGETVGRPPLWQRRYYLRKLPGWVWRNHRHAESREGRWFRLKYLLKLLVDKKMRRMLKSD